MMAGGIGWADGGVGWKDGGVQWGPGHNPVKPRPNRFADCENVSELIYQLVGAGSTCWVGGTGNAVFNDGEAKAVADAGIERLIELGWVNSEHTDT